MKARVCVTSAGVVAALLVLASSAAIGQDSIAAARELYSTASYEEALTVLDRLRPLAGNTATTRTIEQYRAFCLVALGRTQEAEQAVEALVAVDPTYVLPAGEAPPRIATMFSMVRQRVLPSVVRARFEAAKSLHAEKRYAEAASAFSELIALLNDPAVVSVAGEDLAGLKTVASGFLDLARASQDAASRAATQQMVQAAASLPSQPQAPPPVMRTGPTHRPRSPGAPQVNGQSTQPDRSNTATPAVSGSVVPPGIISQQLPRATGLALPAGASAIVVLDILIDEVGRVQRATIRQSANAFYEAQLLTAAKTWRYTPATQAGKPVRYVKTLEITLTPR